LPGRDRPDLSFVKVNYPVPTGPPTSRRPHRRGKRKPMALGHGEGTVWFAIFSSCPVITGTYKSPTAHRPPVTDRSRPSITITARLDPILAQEGVRCLA